MEGVLFPVRSGVEEEEVQEREEEEKGPLTKLGEKVKALRPRLLLSIALLGGTLAAAAAVVEVEGGVTSG